MLSRHVGKIIKISVNIPTHDVLSCPSSYPVVLQEQEKDPILSVQISSQTLSLVKHSLISKSFMKYVNNHTIYQSLYSSFISRTQNSMLIDISHTPNRLFKCCL